VNIDLGAPIPSSRSAYQPFCEKGRSGYTGLGIRLGTSLPKKAA